MEKNVRKTTILNKRKLSSSIEAISLQDLSTLNHTLNYYWVGVWGCYNESDVDRLNKEFPFFKTFINFPALLDRTKKLLQVKQDTQTSIKNDSISIEVFFGFNKLTISEFFPELHEIKTLIREKLINVSDKIFKAKLWLYPYAIYSRADVSIEANIYFKCWGSAINSSEEIEATWLTECHKYLIRDDIAIHKRLDQDILEKAKSGKLTIEEVSDITNFNNELLLYFFEYDRYEYDIFEPAFFRAVEWFKLEKFMPWVNSLSNSISTELKGIDTISMAYKLFYLCRSDLVLQKFPQLVLESMLMSLMHGEQDSVCPWTILWNNGDSIKKVDNLIITSSLLFCYFRINKDDTKNSHNDILERAINFLCTKQLHSGSWPLISGESTGSILATCFAIHGLAVAKPPGWQGVIKKAINWLLIQQKDEGCWIVNYFHPVVLTVLVLDSINLAEGNMLVTFNSNKAITSQTKMVDTIDELVFDFSNEAWFKKRPCKIKSVSKDSLPITSYPKVAILVAVEVELQETLKYLKPLDGKSTIHKINNGLDTYYIGKFGAFAVVVTMSTMGSMGVAGSTLTTVALVNLWNPDHIFLVGIAFGRSREKHKVADVLISESIIAYESQRIGDTTIPRNLIPPSSGILLNRIRNAMDWNFKRPDKTIVKKHIGQILSGEKLVDNKSFKEDLFRHFPNAIGGEMECSGVFSAAERYKKNWIMIKGVCDWADGNKHKEYQQLAAASAVSLCKFILSDKHTFDE